MKKSVGGQDTIKTTGYQTLLVLTKWFLNADRRKPKKTLHL